MKRKKIIEEINRINREIESNMKRRIHRETEAIMKSISTKLEIARLSAEQKITRTAADKRDSKALEELYKEFLSRFELVRLRIGKPTKLIS